MSYVMVQCHLYSLDNISTLPMNSHTTTLNNDLKQRNIFIFRTKAFTYLIDKIVEVYSVHYFNNDNLY